jgi:hypothetical protein
MVPPAASSIEGVFVFPLSPDEKQVLLVWEYGHWKVRRIMQRLQLALTGRQPVSGAGELGESIIATGTREMMEEVRIDWHFSAFI